MKRLFSVALGILTAIGGFVDIGDIVANSETGARFGMSLAWVVVLGVIGICLFAEMAGRVATVSGRAVFDLVRERLGARVGYERRRMKGPLPVRLLFGWLHHDGRYVEWERIERIEPGRILITGAAGDLPAPGPSS